MSDGHSGGCMCGAIRFSYTGEPRFVAECVCESYRRAHGASVVGWVGVQTGAFRLDRGEASLKWYRSSPASERGFCVECGTRLFFRSDNWAGETHMALACIDEPHALKATVLSFPEEMPHWTSVRADVS